MARLLNTIYPINHIANDLLLIHLVNDFLFNWLCLGVSCFVNNRQGLNMHSFPLVETIVAGLFFAFILGFIAQKLRMPPLVGYLLAGIIVGPYTNGYTADIELSQDLAELGVILLMFGVGLHFSIKDLLSVKRVAIPGAIVQISLATILGLGLAYIVGWGVGPGIVFGLALATASTVVLVAALERWHLKDSTRGRIATGWLIVEDIAMVFVLVLIPALAPVLSGDGDISNFDILLLIGKTSLQIIAFIAVMMIVGRKSIPWVLKRVVRTGNPDLFRLGVLAIALGCAILANYLFGVSFALGAFFAGMILSETEMNHTAEKETLGLREFFTVLFFVSVGMLFDPSILIREPLLLLATLFIIIIGKSLGAYFIVKLLGYPNNTALTISAALAQIGEFAFMIASLGVAYKILPPLASDIILGSAMIAIIINPFLFVLLNKFQEKQARLATDSAPIASNQEETVDILADKPYAKVASPIKPASILFMDEDMVIAPEAHQHTIMVGYGPIGQVVLPYLQKKNEVVFVQESRLDITTELRAKQVPVAYGNALAEGMLEAVFTQNAKNLIITISHEAETIEIIHEALLLNPQLNIIVFSTDDEENAYLTKAGATHIIDMQAVLAGEMITVFNNINEQLTSPEVEVTED